MSPKLVKTAELPPDRNYVLGAHPHGIMCTGTACNFATESTGFSHHFPGLRASVATLASLFRLPVFREYLMALGEREGPTTYWRQPGHLHQPDPPGPPRGRSQSLPAQGCAP